ncbi:DEAD/DEAH box helicase [Mycolicibacterium gadium]|uniref:Helicase associated domain protein n=1 Tax=Mycolicibacterium gadium TaxID=1794 RepID=A0ABT6GV26_MYCGU|nr:DEAD/DEAH box helicase [Mycolicibacterium gadium]MDG5485484.1 Helicase associated domain protein [Mycolicibacterium gadium]
MGTFDKLFARLDPDPRTRGKQFERICHWYLSNDPTYRATLRRVWMWDEWDGRWGADAGIDLVAEDHEDRLWAIQCKAYDPRRSVTKTDVDKFLSESARSDFSYRLLIASTDGLHYVARNTIYNQEKQVALIDLSDLMTSTVQWPVDPADLAPSPRPAPAVPRQHQKEAVTTVARGFADSDRGQLIMACGTGKTLTSLFIREQLYAERTLVLLPSLSLLKQTMQVWRINARVPFDALPVCSDETVGRGAEDAAVGHVSELAVPVTSDPAEIADFLRRPGPRVVFSTYQSSPQVAKAFDLGDLPSFDLAIGDEAHRIAGVQTSDFATILDDIAIPSSRRLFMTATPRFFTGRVQKAAQDADLEVASMDDESKFGPVFHHLSFGDAISRDLLTDYQVVVVGVSDQTYSDWVDRGALVSRSGQAVTDARTLAGQIGLAKAIQKYDLRRTISFHSRVERARKFAAELPDVIAWMPEDQRPDGVVWSRVASGEMTAGRRHVLLQHLARLAPNERGLLANARCLSEGVDVPMLDGVAFIDPRRSEVDIVQAVGRAIRKSDEKSVGTIVIPVFVPTGADAEVLLKDSAFKPVWDVVQALRAHDEELGERLDELRRQLGREGGQPKLPAKIHLDLPLSVGSEFAAAFEVRLIEQTTASWEQWYGLLEEYVMEHGTSRVPQSQSYKGSKLGLWVTVQRSKWKSLSHDRRERLIGLPGWSPDVRADQWEEGFTHLRNYVDDRGDARVRDDHVADDGYNLGKWVGKQRAKWDSLGPERQERLAALAGWTLDAREALWESSFKVLAAYATEHGSATPPRGFEADGVDLESWVRRQRRTWDLLGEERRDRLQRLPGWTLDARNTKWDNGYRRLLEYVAQHGNAQVPQSYKVDGYALGKWLSVQRRTWDTLSEERRQCLRELPGWTLDARGEWWEEGFGHLQTYVKEHGTAALPQDCEFNGFKLGSWVSNQKARWNQISDDRRKRLQELPGWELDARNAHWEEGLRRFRDYAREHGHGRVPQKYEVDGYKLGVWLNTQRSNWSKLPDERRNRLSESPGWVLNAVEDLWENGFEHLRAYVGEHGTAQLRYDCIYDGFKLGQWVTVQRKSWDTLTDDRRRRLTELAGWAQSTRDVWWENGFSALKRFVARHGHAAPPQSYVDENDFRLGAWVAKQRQTRAKGKLSDGRSQRLGDLSGWEWTARSGSS